MRVFRHKNTGTERKLGDDHKLVAVLESSPSWEELTEPAPKPKTKPKPEAK